MKLYMFRAVPLSFIRSSFTVHSAMVYVIQVCRQLLSRTRMELQWYMSYRSVDSFLVGPGWNSNGICHTGLKTAFEQDQDGTPMV